MGRAVLDNLEDRRGIRQALDEVDRDVYTELEQTIGGLAWNAVAKVVEDREGGK